MTTKDATVTSTADPQRSPAPQSADTLARGDAPALARVSIRGLRKEFQRIGGEVVTAIDDVDLDVAPAEFLVLLGPSGCGKTTLLRCIAGLEDADAGAITVADDVVFDSARGLNQTPENRPLSMIFQSYALWPHMTVAQNIEFPLQNGGVSRADRNRRVRQILATAGIPELADQYPGEISGGQQQRVALARAMVSNAETVLFDEPLSNVDAKIRDQLRLELQKMQRELGFTAVYVTHDQQEAMSLATRIAVLREGQIEQLGPPSEIYRRPRNLYVARFIGSLNELACDHASQDGAVVVHDTALGPVAVADAEMPTGIVRLVSRPEAWQICADPPSERNCWRGTVVGAAFLGSYTEYLVAVGDHEFKIWTSTSDAFATDDEVWVAINPQDLRALPDQDRDPQ